MNDNKKLPSGWGEDDDEDFGFDSVDDNNGDTPWGNSTKAKPSKNTNEVFDTDKAESSKQALDSASKNIESSDIPAESLKPKAVNNPAPVPVYSNNTASKSKAVPILIAVIAILVIALISVGILFLTKNKSDNSETPESSTSEQNTTESQTEKSTEISTTEKTTEEKTSEETKMEAEPTSASNSDSNNKNISAEINNYPLYLERLEIICNNLGSTNYSYDSGLSIGYSYNDVKVGYTLIDLNDDTLCELITTQKSVLDNSSFVVEIYTISNNKLIMLCQAQERLWYSFCENNIIRSSSAMGQGGGNSYYKYENGDKLTLIETVSFDYSSGNKTYHHNNSIITENEADSICSKYIGKELKTEFLEAIEKPENEPTSSIPFETYAFLGVVSTESDSLNLRDKPSTDSNVISYLPKGMKGSIYYVDGYPDWYKIYTVDGQEGYVSAQYIKEYIEPITSGVNTPWGTFSYSNYDEDRYNPNIYSNVTICEPQTIGVYVNCDISTFNSTQSKYRIDNVYFWTLKTASNINKPHDYEMSFTFTGTVTADSITGFYPELYLRNETTGFEEQIKYSNYRFNLYNGETFCIDLYSDVVYKNICDNTTYTLIIK